MTSALYIGIMSGTSLDGVDVALVEFDTQQPQVLRTFFLAYPLWLTIRNSSVTTPYRK